MIAALRKDNHVVSLRHRVRIGLPFGVIGGVFHVNRFLLDVVDLLRNLPVLAAQTVLQIGIGELRAHGEEDVDTVDQMGFRRRTDLDFHALARKNTLHHRVIRFSVVNILHKPLALHLGDKRRHRAVHANTQKLHRLRLRITEYQRDTKKSGQ